MNLQQFPVLSSPDRTHYTPLCDQQNRRPIIMRLRPKRKSVPWYRFLNLNKFILLDYLIRIIKVDNHQAKGPIQLESRQNQ